MGDEGVGTGCGEGYGRVGVRGGETQNKRIATLINLRNAVDEISLTSGSQAQSAVGLLGRKANSAVVAWPV